MQYYYITDIKWETKPINKMFSVSRKVLPNQICLTESVVSQAHGRTDGLEGRPTTYKTIYNEINEMLSKIYKYAPKSFEFYTRRIKGGYNWKKLGGNKWKTS